MEQTVDDGVEEFWEMKLPAYRTDCICGQAIKGLGHQAETTPYGRTQRATKSS